MKRKSTCKWFAAILISWMLASAVAFGGTIVRIETNMGTFDVELFDDRTPMTVANFLSIVEKGNYDNSFFHRSVANFIIQGGGFLATLPDPIEAVPPVQPVKNEPGIPNTRGTIAMAKRADDPDSATTQWFINMSDNPDLDTQNGGFTVFGEVLGNGMQVADAINALPIFDARAFGGAFETLPVRNFTGSNLTNDNLVIVHSIRVVEEDTTPLPDTFSLYLPVPPAGNGGFNGIAVTNGSGEDIQVEAELFPVGTGRAGPGPESVEASFPVAANAQTARLITDADLFGENPPVPAWIGLSSSDPTLGSFFQFGTATLSQLDGGVAVSTPSKTLYFPRVFDGPEAFRGQAATTLLSLFNPSEEPVAITLRYHPAQDPQASGIEAGATGSTAGAGLAGQRTVLVLRTIKSKSSFFETAGELFGTPLEGGYIEVEVTEGEGVFGFEVIRLENQETVMGLNALSETETTLAFSAQLASDSGLFTNVSLNNTSDESRMVTLTAVTADGTLLSEPVAFELAPGRQFSGDAGELFGNSGEDQTPAVFDGSLQVESDGPGVIGDVIFGDSETFQFAASLALQNRAFRRAVFNQMASVDGFFTGLALFNPADIPAEVDIRVFSSAGELIDSATVELLARHRDSRLISQFVPASQGLAGGFVRLEASQPIIAQFLFGTVDSSGTPTLFSAVPPTILE